MVRSVPHDSRFTLADKLLDGQLEAHLRRLRADGVSYDEMVQWFKAEGIHVSRETLRRWVLDLDEPEAVGA